jgi:hypothetical protein
MMKKIIIVLSIGMFCLSITPAHSQQIKAKTEDGKDVILYPNGTWQFVKTEEPPPPPASGKTQPPPAQAPPATPGMTPAGAKKVVTGKRGTYELRYDETKWKVAQIKFNPAAEFCFIHTAGDAYAMIIDETMQMPLDMLKTMAWENVKKTVPDVHITDEGKKTINNNEVLYMKMEGTSQMKPVTYLGYYYTGNGGTIQLITYAAQDILTKIETDMVDFLNGFAMENPAQQEIKFADGSQYIGTVVNGKMQGFGTYIWTSGDKYIGEFTDNKATGGWFYKSDGRKAWCHQDENGVWVIRNE